MTRTRHFASYHEAIFDSKQRSKIVRASVRMINTLRENDESIYAIVGTGVSGILGAIVADACDMDFIYIRRKNESPHDYRKAVGNIGPGRYVFYDDLLDSGKTLVHCLDVLGDLRKEDWSGAVKQTPDLASVICYDTSRPYTSVSGRATGCAGFDKYSQTFDKTPVYSVPFFANTGRLRL